MNATQTLTVEHIPIHALIPSKTNPPERITEPNVKDLAADVAHRGVLEPIKARPLSGKPSGSYGEKSLEIVFGHRRWAASKVAKRETIPVIVQVMTDAEALEEQAIENLQSEDLHPLQEAELFHKLIEGSGIGDHAEAVRNLSDRLAKKPAYIEQHLKLIDLVPKAKEAFRKNGIALGHALELCRLETADQEKAIHWLLEGNYVQTRSGQDRVPGRTVHQLQAWIHGNLLFDLTKAPFDIHDATLSKKYGACDACPHRTGANKSLFSDISKGDWCTVPSDYFAKRNLTIDRKVDELTKERGVPKLLRVGIGDQYDNSQKSDAYLPVDVYVGSYNATAKQVANGDECSNTKPGVIVFASRNANGKMLSQVNVCIKPGECSKHSRESRNSSGPREKIAPSERDKRRVEKLSSELKTKQRDALIAATCRAAIKLDSKVAGKLRDILRPVANQMSEMLYSDRHRELAKNVLGLDPHQFKSKGHSGPDYDAMIDTVFEKRPLAWLVACALMNDTFRGTGDLEALTKAFGVDAKKVHADAKAAVDAKIAAIKTAAERREAKAKKGKRPARSVPAKGRSKKG